MSLTHRRSYRTLLGAWIALLAVLLALVPRPALAAEVRGGNSEVIEAGTTINDDLYVFGSSVDIQGTVNGDVISSASLVTVSGVVNGDLTAAAGTIEVPGEVQGSIRAAAGNVSIDGAVRDDVLLTGGTLTIGQDASIGRDVLFGGGTATLNGQIGRNVRAGSGELNVNSQVGGTVNANVGQLAVADSAVIGGDLIFSAEQDAAIAPGAAIGGQTLQQTSPEAAPPTTTEIVMGYVASWLRMLVALFLVGLTIVLLFPAFSRRATNALATTPWQSAGIGVALFFGLPILAVLVLIVGIFVGGWWLAPILLGVYAAALAVGIAIAALFVGRTLLVQFGQGDVHPVLAVLLGVALLALIGIVPVLGAVIGLIAAIAGLGALARALWLTQHHGAAAAPVA